MGACRGARSLSRLNHSNRPDNTRRGLLAVRFVVSWMRASDQRAFQQSIYVCCLEAVKAQSPSAEFSEHARRRVADYRPVAVVQLAFRGPSF